ncbi:hypothetical protein [Allobranchiibius sp. CTAmp26]|uniref:hypothetical protein n=1 Tax=Allobranchiibius sp. CTAmp26 TaxID=2815214 RepID=UPI001AA11CC6|nr:hypothetical protein [Allobranchiibius sp. CTAmp26]MBO1754783.1 hypothetical protein [Allobranchiibius sp. CTAmp26]
MDTITTPYQAFPVAMSYPLRIRVRQQGYAFTRRDALEFGASDEQLRAWCHAEDVLSGAQGSYFLPPGDIDTTTSAAETQRRRIRALLLVLGDGYVVTHQSSLLAWDLPIDPSCNPTEIHLGHREGHRWSRRPGVRLHRVPAPIPITTASGIPTVAAAYAIVQVGAGVGVEAAVVPADAALRNYLASPTDLAEAVERSRGTPGCTRLATLLDLVDPRSESPGESRLRLLLRAAGVPVTPQVVIRDDAGHFVARVDLLVDGTRTIVEFDGLLKYRGAGNSEALVNEKRRELALQRLGYRVVRVVWDDLTDPDRVLSLLRPPSLQTGP